MLDQIEQRLLCPVQVVEHADERALPRLLLEQLAEAPRDLVCRGRGLASPSSERIGSRPSPSGSASSCLTISTTGQ